MDCTERFYKIDQLLSERRCVSMDTLIEVLGTSKATVKRDLEYLRGRLYAPIVWERALRAYRYDATDPRASGYKLPGLWFSAAEIHALLTRCSSCWQISGTACSRPISSRCQCCQSRLLFSRHRHKRRGGSGVNPCHPSFPCPAMVAERAWPGKVTPAL